MAGKKPPYLSLIKPPKGAVSHTSRRHELPSEVASAALREREADIKSWRGVLDWAAWLVEQRLPVPEAVRTWADRGMPGRSKP